MHVVVVYFQSVWHTSDVHKCYNILCHELELSRLLYDLVNLIFDQKINIILLVLLMLVLLQIVWRMPGLSEEENWKSGSLRLCHSQFRYGEHQHHITSHYTQHTAQGTPATFTAQLRVVTSMPTHPLQLHLSLWKVTS